jgi:predicted metal-dependent HD superfamily phosphohydrolase
MFGIDDEVYHEQVMALYDQPWRRYHTRDHIRDVHMFARALRALYGVGPTRPFALERAIDLHDVVYVPGKKGSEEASAMLADSYNYEEVGRLIRLTEFHEPLSDDLDGCFIVDADLYGLAMPWYDYEANTYNIHEEYAGFFRKGSFSDSFDRLWVAGRKKWAQDFLERPRIFHGPGTNLLEQAARDNLKQELANLCRS